MKRAAFLLPSVLVLVMFAGASVREATANENIFSAMPKFYAGCFSWDGDMVGQEVRYAIVTIKAESGTAAFTGEGLSLFLTSVHRVSISGRINTEELAVEIWESNVQALNRASSGGYITDGSYRGRFSSDLRTLSARWETNGENKGGDLLLQAVKEEEFNPGMFQSRPCNRAST